MTKITVSELNIESFNKYGFYANMINPEAPKLGCEPIEFYRDMVMLDLGQNTNAAFSICRVCKRPDVVDVSEFHDRCGEGILPLDSDVLIHVAPASTGCEVPVEKIEIFRVPKGTMVVLRPGVWHHAPFAYKSDVANVLIVLPERTYAVDCKVTELTEDNMIEIDCS